MKIHPARDLKAYFSALLHHWLLTAILLVVVGVFLSVTFTALYNKIRGFATFLPAPPAPTA